MPVADQNIKPGRYQIIPRVLVFALRGEHVLLVKIAGKSPRWNGKYNGAGGHVEAGESPLAAARRELLEETGLTARLQFSGYLAIDTGESPGIGLFVFHGQVLSGEPVPGPEGEPAWIPLAQVGSLPVLEDVPILLGKIINQKTGSAPFMGRSFYDATGVLRVEFTE